MSSIPAEDCELGAVWRPILPESIREPFARIRKARTENLTIATDVVVFAVGLTPSDALYRSCIAGRVAA